MNLSLVCDVFFLVILMSCMMSWIIYMLSSATQQQAVAHKIEVEARKPVRGNMDTSDTQFEIIHGTHFWTVRNILALDFAQVREFSSKTFEVESDHGNDITTIFR